jgi:hypothetical protein
MGTEVCRHEALAFGILDWARHGRKNVTSSHEPDRRAHYETFASCEIVRGVTACVAGRSSALTRIEQIKQASPSPCERMENKYKVDYDKAYACKLPIVTALIF